MAATQIFSICLLKWDEAKLAKPVFLASAYDISQFGYFQQSGAKEFMRFASRTFLQKTARGSKQVFEHDDYMINCYLRHDRIGCVIISVKGYNERVIFSLAENLIKDLTNEYESEISKIMGDSSLALESLKLAIVSYQKPSEVDKIVKVQKQIDDVKEIVHQAIDTAFDNGKKLDDLVRETDDLSAGARMYYLKAKEKNRCCVIL